MINLNIKINSIDGEKLVDKAVRTISDPSSKKKIDSDLLSLLTALTPELGQIVSSVPLSAIASALSKKETTAYIQKIAANYGVSVSEISGK